MHFSLDDRTCSLSVGEFADFTLGPRDSTGGPSGLWRAQLGQHWHGELRRQAGAEHPDATFELPVHVAWPHGGWTFTFSGRIDQLIPVPGTVIVREIKTVLQPLPAAEAALRTDYPSYFIQLATYAALLRPEAPGLRAELVFVETGSGLSQTIAFGPSDEAIFTVQLERVVEFLNLRLRARERLRHLRFQPAFTALRAGQETIQADLAAAFDGSQLVESRKPKVEGAHVPEDQISTLDPRLSTSGCRPSSFDLRHSAIVFLEAPTGFGKTGIMLEFALTQLRASRFTRVIYLTGKSTGQLQVVRTLAAMTDLVEGRTSKAESTAVPGDSNSKRETPNTKPATATSVAVAAWQVRPKSEHCVNSVFHCVRDACSYLAGAAERWPGSGLAGFYLFDGQARDLDTLRAAGRNAHICPYEITRAALPFNDVWIADYNYVFSPSNRTFFLERPGYDPSQTLLLIDEAHNLPARVADAHSHAVSAGDAVAMPGALEHVHAPDEFVRAWENWARLLSTLEAADSLDPVLQADITDALHQLAELTATTPVDYAVLGPRYCDLLWQAPALAAFLDNSALKKILWCPRDGELRFTCLDAASAIGETLRQYGGVILASATLRPFEEYAEACGLRDSKPKIEEGRTPKASVRVSSASSILNHKCSIGVSAWTAVQALTPWREGAYDIAVDLRVDTRFQQRVRHHATTAATVEALHSSPAAKPRDEPSIALATEGQPTASAVAVFFPSYAYAEAILHTLEASGSVLRVALQPRGSDLAAQTAWVEESLALSDALFLVLGSSFAEGIDVLGGRVTRAMVVGPALPEVNAVQKARLTALEREGLTRDAAFRRVYQIPGMTKVNQALGRLVRAPGQRAKVLLHCERFAEPSYAALLATDYQFGAHIATDTDLTAWLAKD